MLMVDWAKRNQVCWNRKGAIGEGLKAIHWSLLVAAWYQEYGCGEEEEHHVHDQSANILRTMIGFYAIFDFSKFRICAFDQPPFTESFLPASARPPMWISSPVDAGHNLADRVTAHTVSQIQTTLVEARKHLWVSPHALAGIMATVGGISRQGICHRPPDVRRHDRITCPSLFCFSPSDMIE